MSSKSKDVGSSIGLKNDKDYVIFEESFITDKCSTTSFVILLHSMYINSTSAPVYAFNSLTKYYANSSVVLDEVQLCGVRSTNYTVPTVIVLNY